MPNYYDVRALSYSGMKDLAISPLHYWYKHLNPDRPPYRETPAMSLGKALHCAVLEPNEFSRRYAQEVAIEDYPDCLVTIEDMRQWLKDKGHTPKGTRKDQLIMQVQAIDEDYPIFDVIKQNHEEQNAGKVILSVDDWLRTYRAADAIRCEPVVSRVLKEGEAEYEIFVKDVDTNIPLKAKLDWRHPEFTLDIKTFSQTRGKSIDQTVNDAIYYEKYYLQGYFYHRLRKIKDGEGSKHRFLNVFVESTEPYEVRIRELKPKSHGQANLYWEFARVEVKNLIDTYAHCIEKFGDEPWITESSIQEVTDEHMRQFAYL